MDTKKSISIDEDIVEDITALAKSENTSFSAMTENACEFLLNNLELYFKQKSEKYNESN